MDFNPSRLRTAAILGLLAVALGAMGAHGLETHWEKALGHVEAAHRLEVWKTASHYHLAHAIVLLVLAFAFPSANQARAVWWSLVAGITLFSGSLYFICLTDIKARVVVLMTPAGGVLLMLGWLLLAFQRRKLAKCDLCEKEARVFATWCVDGKVTQQRKLCEKCAKEQNALEPTGFRFTQPPPA